MPRPKIVAWLQIAGAEHRDLVDEVAEAAAAGSIAC